MLSVSVERGISIFYCAINVIELVPTSENHHMQVENVYLEPPSQRNKARVAKRNFEVAEGDLLTLLNVFNAYKQQEQGSLRHWCSSRFLNHKALRRADQLYDQVGFNEGPFQ